MNSINITIKFGTANQITQTYTIPVTVGRVLNDAAIARRLGFEVGRVTGSLGNVEQPDATTLADGDTLVVTSKSCGKAGV